MIEPDESAIAILRIQVRPIARQNVGMQVNLTLASRLESTIHLHVEVGPIAREDVGVQVDLH